ncbi:Uncharacterized protein ALO70_00703 [Pseudomonas amygdali pv. eriobotryae]|uniref:Uncharacterized protein n=1 Tax=Pseudomonas amygdali pv. eriobotryae TaxID=129137 RepID=A0A0P9PQJ2_PSEA0|nr:hypothetical protein [Pseudomonas amygdali]KPX19833.1 Uncharacterized protein ALO70_00703 [Pseudomonas amygdali pv. eriobotryae]KWS76857.1 acetyltransferase [Pseudomonas amygdali pv. eriobotryae]RMM02742.1 hypothetical protein ALQ86_01056 [Pseudomonas amygdali pv. eriobotryae]RMO50448.1 hypothetical protein ALQ39_03517 [Pseudomonas amygdali pv. eriobotryae]GFZ70596.1 hypothetical protein PSE10C_13380 [Pseudomonas amygdali pv. eriobotryae]
MNLKHTKFSDIDFQDVFFDSLKTDYKELPQWFAKKAEEGSSAYIFINDHNKLDGFLYLKLEKGPVNDIAPALPDGTHLKIGTLKINAHGTKLGERFLKKIFDHLILHKADDAYVTIFEKHKGLISLFEKYGFVRHGSKDTANGVELVYKKTIPSAAGNPTLDYPTVNMAGNKIHLLAVKPEFHSILFPDSILHNEDPALIVRDVSHTNSIHKVYLCNMPGVAGMKRGDALVIYRTGDGAGAARFRAVASSVCVVEETKHMNDFNNIEDYLKYCRPHSVFSENELIDFYRRKNNQFIVRFTYNIAFPKRPNRGRLIDEAGVDEALRWSCIDLSRKQFDKIIEMGSPDERLIVN